MTGWAAHEVLAPATGGLHGRDRDIAAVAEALAASRLVSLTGAPGIGKSRLALAVADQHRESVAVVELAAVTDPSFVPAALASALSVHEVARRRLIDTIVATHRDRPLLLLLDNCEHLLGACAEAIDTILAGCSRARILTTSREPLGLDGERVWQVAPLRVPQPDADTDPEALISYPSVALFVERAADAQPGFALNAFIAPDVAETCRRLDGIPLAIELAAARVGTLTPGEIAGRLGDQLTLLSGGSPSRLPRHQTLETALDWSHALLDDHERTLLRRLSVFVGRFELAAVEAVCTDDNLDPSDVLSVLRRLVSKSLVSADVGPHGQVRYRLLEAVGAYAAEKLERAAEPAVLRTAHAEFYVAVAENAELELTGPRQDRWLERLDAERANLRAALEWSLSSGEIERALRLGGALVLFWRVRGHFSEGRDLLRAVLRSSSDGLARLTATALWGVGFLTLMAGDFLESITPLERSLARFRELQDPRGCARALLILANARQFEKDAEVLAMLEESAELAREAGDSWCLAHALGVAGFESALYDLPRARSLFEECLAVARDAGDTIGLGFGLLGLGRVAVAQGQYDEAEFLLEDAAQVTGSLGEDYDRASVMRWLAELAIGRGDYARARERLLELLDVHPEAAPSEHKLVALVRLAEVAQAEGDYARARELLTEVQRRARGSLIIQVEGELAFEQGDFDTARGLFVEARRQAEGTGEPGAIAKALYALAEVARATDDLETAAALHAEALELRHRLGELPPIADSLEAVAGLAAAACDHEHAARIFGAAATLRDKGAYARPTWQTSRYEADIDVVRGSVDPPNLGSTLTAGASLPLDQAVAEALSGARPTGGWRSLTQREREVVGLVAEGLTNLEIADRLVISLETVKTHLSHIFSKLEMSGRRELAREVRRRNGWAVERRNGRH